MMFCLVQILLSCLVKLLFYLGIEFKNIQQTILNDYVVLVKKVNRLYNTFQYYKHIYIVSFIINK